MVGRLSWCFLAVKVGGSWPKFPSIGWLELPAAEALHVRAFDERVTSDGRCDNSAFSTKHDSEA